MLVCKQIGELRKELAKLKKENKTIGFVPTMGALHQGHISLIDASLKQADVTVASIFVNPTQFNNPDDLKNYPRTLEDDLKILNQQGCHFVFTPTEEEMYPEKDERIFDFDGIEEVMEGEHRPGHFNGVAQIVSKLFMAVEPDMAFFGEKDFQQVAIIRAMTDKLKLPVEIISCPIIREHDGLAMSSRNKLLSPEHRTAAPLIFKTLTEAKLLIKEKGIGDTKQFVATEIKKEPLLKLEYFEIVEAQTLKPVDSDNGKVIVGCIAVWAGKVRLIDNIIF